MSSFIKKIIAVVGILILSTIPSNAFGEVRTYLRQTETLHTFSKGRNIGVFFKEENRFRKQGMVLSKVFVGLNVKVHPWLILQAYYAHKDMYYTKHKARHLLDADIIVVAHKGAFTFLNRNESEWHINDGYYRHRNYSEVAYQTFWQWLKIWSSEEFRYDFDQNRINVNDNRVGLAVKPKKGVTGKLFFDEECKRRSSVGWHYKPFLGVSISAKM